MNPDDLKQLVDDNQLDEAAHRLEAECAAARETSNNRDLAQGLNDLGVVCLLLGRTDEARAQLNEAQQLFITLDDAAGQGRAVGNLAQLEEHSGASDVAAGLYLQAADLLHEGYAYADEYTTRRRLSKFYFSRGATLMSLSEMSKALAVKPNAGFFDQILGWLYAMPLKLMGIPGR